MLDIADEAIGSRGVYSTLLIEDYRLINDRHLAKKKSSYMTGKIKWNTHVSQYDLNKFKPNKARPWHS